MQSQKLRKRCTKLVLFLIFSMMLMITVVTFANLWAMEAPEREWWQCNQIINKRCGVIFDMASLELGDNNDWGFQDVGYEFKCGLNNSAELLEAELLAKGWHCERFPALMVQEILSNTAFRVEMDKMNSEYKSYWLYVDIDYQRNGHKSKLFKDSVYSTPHYQVALYVPEINTLYYLEYSI